MSAPFPRVRLREPSPELLELPWELPLEAWPPDIPFRDLPVGPSRHLVRFLAVDGGLIALKEEPVGVAEGEYAVLRHLAEAGLPAVDPIGLAAEPARDAAILVTRYLPNSLQYRLLLSRVPPGPGHLRDQLLDAMAGLLVELHRGGVYWGDCSLANTLFRRDGNKNQAYLVDAGRARSTRPSRTASGASTWRSSSRTSRSGWQISPRPRGATISSTTPSPRPRPSGIGTRHCGRSCTPRSRSAPATGSR